MKEYPRRKKFFYSVIALLLCLLALFGKNHFSLFEKNTMISDVGFYFDTVVTIQLYDTEDTSLLEQCFALCENYENLFSPSRENSDIARINQSNGAPVTVASETISLIQTGLYYSELSNGAFDITIAPLSTLWNFHTEQQSLCPDDTQIQEAISHIDYRQVQIEDNTVTLSDPNASLDLGGIAKGYIADRLKEYLLEQGITSGLINLGGNVLLIGEKPDKSSFQIGIQKPFADAGEYMQSLNLRDCSVVTSGVYERYFETDGVLYHHLLNPSTGYPYQTGLYSVTILNDSSIDGDALSTICFALGLEDGMALIESLDGVEAIFITDTYQIYDTGVLSDDMETTS